LRHMEAGHSSLDWPIPIVEQSDGRCPQCGYDSLMRSRTRTLERWRKWFLGSRPYRCKACGWRGWLSPAA